MHQVQDEELEQTWGTEGAETIGEAMPESNGIADKEEVEKRLIMQSTDSEVSKVIEASEDKELAHTSGMKGAQTGKPIPIRMHNKPKKAQDHMVAPEGMKKSFYSLLLLH